MNMGHIIKTYRNFLALALCVLATGNTMAQEAKKAPYQPYAPTGIPTHAPLWMQQLTDIENVNYHAMVDSFEEFRRQHPEMRRKSPTTKAVINYFRRWQKAYLPYVAENGKIEVPSFADFRSFVEDINSRQHDKPLTRAAANSQWEVLSPLRTYHMEKKTMYPGQANVQRFDVSRTNPNVLYCGTETGMMFKTTNKGEEWTECTGNYYFGGEITTVEISYQNENKVLMGAGSFLWLTTDGGATWTDITPAPIRSSGKLVRDAIFHPANDQRMVVATAGGLYQTADNGATWTLLQNGECFDVKHKHGDANTIYAMVRDGGNVVLKASVDGGENFETISPQLGYNLACGRIGLSEAPGGHNYIYVLACKTDNSLSFKAPYYFGTPILLKSTDGGTTWIKHEDIAGKMNSIEISWGQGYYDMLISASADNPEHLLFGLLNLYRSDDGGETVKIKGGYIGEFDLHCDMQDIQVKGGDTWISTDGGMVYSPDFFGTKAEAKINGIYASEFFGFDQGWNEDVMVGGRNHNGDMAQMDRYNGAAIHMGGSETATGYVLLSNPRKVAFSDTNPKSVILPDDWHAPFVPFVDFWTFPYEQQQYGMGLEFDPRYAKSFLIFKGSWEDELRSLWKTVDDGQSFVELYRFPKAVTSHVISRSNPDKIVVSTACGLYYSLDGGESFTMFDNLPGEILNSLTPKAAIHPTNENEIWVATENAGGIYRTTNNGDTWEKLDRGLTIDPASPLKPAYDEQVVINRFFLTGNDKNAVYAIGSVSRPKGNGYNAPRGRIFHYDDTIGQWEDYSEGLPPVITIARMLPFYKNGKIRIATSNGIWQRDLKDKTFKPIAQPLILNAGKADKMDALQVEFDSYSIVNQENVSWEWEFNPQPLSVSDATARNPIVTIAPNQSYDVTLTVTTPEGSDTKTVKQMIAGEIAVPTNLVAQEVLKHDVLLSTNVLRRGESIRLHPSGVNKPCTWQLYNASGKLIATQEINVSADATISTAGLTSGVYFYVIANATFKKTGKLIIQ